MKTWFKNNVLYLHLWVCYLYDNYRFTVHINTKYNICKIKGLYQIKLIKNIFNVHCTCICHLKSTKHTHKYYFLI